MARIRLFSKRHEQAIYEKRLRVSISRRLCKRLWFLLDRSNSSYTTTSESGWNSTTDLLQEVYGLLPAFYGVDYLYVKSSDQKIKVNLEDFVKGAYPSQVLDVVELFFSEMPEPERAAFQADVNNIFEEENCDWRLTDGQFFQVNSEFLALQVIARSYELMKAEGFEGALDEFKEARNDLVAGDLKGAIHNACKSFESTLKSVLGQQSGNASVLIRALFDKGMYSDLPEDVGRAFGEQVLMALPFIRNKLGGHGQGLEKINFSRSYAELAVNIAGSFIHFAIQRSLEVDQTEKK